ncbi:hypothetical protein BU17DRAFT_60319 [Hysterangium stoloniferum]|nr:hypothetical protein BU17DRAFT_60319 [Hysterangium stoloniferum]
MPQWLHIDVDKKKNRLKLLLALDGCTPTPKIALSVKSFPAISVNLDIKLTSIRQRSVESETYIRLNNNQVLRTLKSGAMKGQIEVHGNAFYSYPVILHHCTPLRIQGKRASQRGISSTYILCVTFKLSEKVSAMNGSDGNCHRWNVNQRRTMSIRLRKDTLASEESETSFISNLSICQLWERSSACRVIQTETIVYTGRGAIALNEGSWALGDRRRFPATPFNDAHGQIRRDLQHGPGKRLDAYQLSVGPVESSVAVPQHV